MKTLPLSFYNRKNVVLIAKELLGKIIITNFNNELTSGRICETEAYAALVDKASHSYNNRRTARNEHMYGQPGISYVYICYGMHQMLNVVTNKKGIPEAVLIRALEPIEGIDIMLKRTGKVKADRTLTRGPGNVAKALGIFKHHSGQSLEEGELIIGDDRTILPESSIGVSKRIGVDGAGTDALLPYRFYIRNNPCVSGYNK